MCIEVYVRIRIIHIKSFRLDMLLNVGIDITLGTVDIRRCHWIKEVFDELMIKNEKFAILGPKFVEQDVNKKVNLILLL